MVGANGSGKSTFLRILAGDEEPSAGNVSIPRRTSLGVLKQDHFAYDDVPILDVVMMGSETLWAAMSEKEELLEGADDEFDGERYAELEQIVLDHDGYTLESRAGEILEGLGIETAVHREPLSILSGGFRLRVLLAQVLAASRDVLLLDEPTNHLDILSIRWLEKFLESFPPRSATIISGKVRGSGCGLRLGCPGRLARALQCIRRASHMRQHTKGTGYALRTPPFRVWVHD